MERYTEIVNRRPPDTLYHYTNNASALSILSSGEIWATNIHYLNDSTEFNYAITLLKRELDNRLASTHNTAEQAAYDEMRKEADLVAKVNVATASFTEQSDDLSQWRGYSNGSGLAIGFRSNELRALAKEHNFVLAPCLYGETDHLGLINELITDALPKYLASSKRIPHLMPRIIKYAPLIKHRKFEAESEWRLTSAAIPCDVERYRFRAGQSTLVPYYAFPITTVKGAIVSDVMCGPTPHRDLAHAAVNSLLIKLGISAEVSLTETPFRNW